MTELETKLLGALDSLMVLVDNGACESWRPEWDDARSAIDAAFAAAEAAQPDDDVRYMQVYRAKLKTRRAMARDIPADMRGWWYDVSPGQTLLLRQAVQADLDRCTLDAPRSQNPDDYMCETMEHGSLVSKAAIEYMNPESCVFAAIRARGDKRIQSGANSSASQ